MKKFPIFLLGFLLPVLTLHAHGDEAAPAAQPAARRYFSIENISDKYELLLKYTRIEPGVPAELTLFVSDINTNRPVRDLGIEVVTPTDPEQKISIFPGEPGIFKLETSFAFAKEYALNVTLRGGLGPDLIQLNGIEPGKALPGDAAETHAHAAGGAWVALGMLLAFLAGMALTMLLARRQQKAAVCTLAILLVSGFPLENLTDAGAHGDEDRNEKSSPFGDRILVPKETQFLFDVTIARAGERAFTPAINLFGTVVPGARGKAALQAPLAGTLRSLRVHVGQQVRAGQVLAVLEQTVDAGTSINWQSERNALEAEVEAAQKAVGRLDRLQDIIAKRELDEAAARLQRARENRDLFQQLYQDVAGRNARFFPLTAPIDGRVEPFTLSPGATVSAGETVFTLLNPAKVIVEAQLYDKDAGVLREARHFQIECSNSEHKSLHIRLLALPNSINPTNQSQKALFEVDNADGDFKIGEFVNVRIFEQNSQRQMLAPNSAVTEISGMPAVFVKESAEFYSLHYLKTGADNGEATVVEKGLEAGERFVTSGAYQLKMVYFNQ